VVGFETDEAGQTTVVARPYPRQDDDQEMRFPAETVVIALGLRANHRLAEGLRAEAGLEVHVVGDCVEPREALEAVWEGFEVGRNL
jgi:2-enoate reductase